MAIALGIDCEHITHTPAYRNLDAPNDTSIDLVHTTKTLLELFDGYDVSATFFIVAELAEAHPDLIKRIEDRGHEIASHTVTHCSLPTAADETVVDELHRSKAILEEVVTQRVRGFRAPTCQIDDDVYTTLAVEGYDYSSSVMPSIPIPGFYSNEYAFSEKTSMSTPAGDVMEIPLSVHPIARLPISGAWMRLLGRTYTLHGMQALLQAEQDVVTYSHPWEFESLKETSLPFRNRVRTGAWLVDTYERILELDAEFCTVGELVERTASAKTYTVAANPS